MLHHLHYLPQNSLELAACCRVANAGCFWLDGIEPRCWVFFRRDWKERAGGRAWRLGLCQAGLPSVGLTALSDREGIGGMEMTLRFSVTFRGRPGSGGEGRAEGPGLPRTPALGTLRKARGARGRVPAVSVRATADRLWLLLGGGARHGGEGRTRGSVTEIHGVVGASGSVHACAFLSLGRF